MFINNSYSTSNLSELIKTAVVEDNILKITSEISAEMSEQDLINQKANIQRQQLNLKNQMLILKNNYDKLSNDLTTIDELLLHFNEELPEIIE